MEQISVLLIEDELDCLRGLSNYLSNEEYINVVGQTTSQIKGIQMASQLNIEVVLISIDLNSLLNSIQTSAEITKSSHSKVIILTETEEEGVICEALKSGAVDYIVKANFKEIPAAILAVYYERTPIRPYVAKKVPQEFIRLKDIEQQFEIAHMKSLLTPTEINILYFIECGHSQREISELLFVTLRTVKNHVCNILRKTGEKSSEKAARKAKEIGIFRSQLE